MPLTIGSYNLHNVAVSRMQEKLRVAEVINDTKHNFDIVALQEVTSEATLEALVRKLGRDWTHGQLGKTPGQGKGLGFVWRSSRVKLHSGHLGCFRKNEYLWPDRAGVFTRAPFITTFEYRANTLTLINLHLDDGRADYDTKKAAEFAYLCLKVYEAALPKKPASYCIALGDYNLLLRDIENRISPDIANTNMVTVQRDKTTFSKNTADGMLNDLDHFTFNAEREGAIVRSATAIPAHKDYCEGESIQAKIAQYRDEFSDHLPVKLVLDL